MNDGNQGTLVIETVQLKVRLLLFGLGIPAGVLAICAVITILAHEPMGTLVTGGSALVLWTVFGIVFSRRRRDPRSQLVLSEDGVELPRGHRIFLPWSEIRSVSMLRGRVTLSLTTEGFELVHAHDPPWLVSLMRLFGRGITLPNQFEFGPSALASTLRGWHQEYVTR